MMLAGFWTGVGFSNLKTFRTRIKKFETEAKSESEKVTPATSDQDWIGLRKFLLF